MDGLALPNLLKARACPQHQFSLMPAGVNNKNWCFCYWNLCPKGIEVIHLIACFSFFLCICFFLPFYLANKKEERNDVNKKQISKQTPLLFFKYSNINVFILKNYPLPWRGNNKLHQNVYFVVFMLHVLTLQSNMQKHKRYNS